MRRAACWWVWAIVVGALVGCLPEGSTNPTPRADTDVDASMDEGAGGSGGEAGSGGAGGAVADAGVGGGSSADAGPRVECRWPADCPDGDCVDGFCWNDTPNRCVANGDEDCPEGETCSGFERAYWCSTPCELEETCPKRPRPCTSNFDCDFGTSCHDGRCINNCVLDTDCGEDGYCLEGQCRPYPTVFEGDPAMPLGDDGQLYAGVGWIPLDYPIGVSMAGYGAREGRVTPYNFSLGGSDRVLEEQDVRVVAISTDDEIIIIIRAPLSWATDALVVSTARKLEALTGVNYSENIIIAATHSHSQPGRYWNLVSDRFGVAGHGLYSPEMADRYADSFARAAKLALDDLRPAKVGWEIVEDFDPQRRIHSDRRGENPEILDDRLLVMRIEELDGTPMAGIVNLSIHGTHMEETWITGDVAGAIEVEATHGVSALAGRPVPVLFFNSNAGDVSPRGDDGVSVPWGKIQVVGKRLWPIYRDAWEGITTRSDLNMDFVFRRIPITYDLMGYDREGREFRNKENDRPNFYGGFQCTGGAADIEAEGRALEDGNLRCLVGIEQLFKYPVVQLQKTTISALRMDELVISTLPGEPTNPLGMAVTDGIRELALSLGEADVDHINFGYAQDHHLYLIVEQDWFLGGYESAQTLWGWAFGQYLVDNAIALGGQLFTETTEPNDTGMRPTIWEFVPDDTVEPTATMGGAGILAEAPERPARGDLISLSWTGGHPGIDLPRVTLERETDPDTFETVMRPGGLPFDSAGFETVTHYRGDYAADHTWTIDWELGFDLPVGTYRMRVEGRAVVGGNLVDYTETGRPFEVVPAALVVRDVQIDGTTLSFAVNYPDGPSNDDGASPFEALVVGGHFLRADAERRFDGAAKRWSFLLGRELPLDRDAQIVLSGAGDLDEMVTPSDGTVDRTLVVARTDGGDEMLQDIEGWPTARFSVEAPMAGEYTVTVTDAWGNTATFDASL